MNSRDLCMLDKLPDLIDAGISSMKIEGRMKSPFYVATVVSAYRAALDEYLEDPDNYTFQENGIKSCVKPVTESFITVSIILSPIVVGRIILAAITLVSIRLSVL